MYQRQELEDLIKTYQMKDNMYEMKKLNNNEEVENILIARDTIFLGNSKMQIKKLDGTIEKYNIERYYPVDEKDEMIKELKEKVEELERRLEDEPTKHTKSTTRSNKSTTNDDVNVESESKTDD
jgi:cell division protein FtsB